MGPADSTFRFRHSVERRTFMAMIAGGFLGARLAAEAQPAGKGHRIGYLSLAPGSSPGGPQTTLIAKEATTAILLSWPSTTTPLEPGSWQASHSRVGTLQD